VDDADQMLDALMRCVALIRNCDEVADMMLPIQVMSHIPKDHRRQPLALYG